MSSNRNLLFYFLLPIALLLVFALFFGGWALHQLKQEFDGNHQLTSTDLKTIEKAALFSQELSEVHQQLMSALTAAEEGRMNELQLYESHSRLVDQLAPMQKMIEEMANSPLLRAINQGTSQALAQAFKDYRRFAIMSTDIIAIDPSTSARYLHQAERKFLEFNTHTSRINQLLAERTRLRTDLTAESFAFSVMRQLLTGLVVLFGVLAGLYIAVKLMTRKLLTITQALTQLARHQQSPPELPEVEHLQQTARGEFKHLASALLAFRDSEIKRLETEEENYRLAYYDQLTGLPNRQQMLEYLNHSLQLCKSNQRLGAVVFLDLDQFKNINEAKGPEVGDLLLQQVALRLSAEVKDKNALGRLSGDEFVLVLDNLDHQQEEAAKVAQDFAERLRLILNQPYQLQGESFRISASLGLTLFNPEQQEGNSLFSKAESAMYQSKKQGGNLCSFFDPKVQAALEERRWLEQELEKAVEHQQLELHYQLQVGQHNQPLGAEALLRWKHPERGFISPGQFIPLAEQTGLILPIGHWVLQTAFEQLQTWQQYPETQGLSLAVNISAKQFQNDDLVRQVKELLSRTGINPQRLKLELTESAILEQMEATIEKMLELKKLGLTFSMDDFGTGYSSLQYLKRLPLDQLKIDQSFIRDLPDDQESAAIAETIIAMGFALQLDVIAEGVETPEQQEFLIRQNCRAFQGYLFARPQPADELIQRLTGSDPISAEAGMSEENSG
ncbi:EAL domain-containing protein [Marinospirillum sp.]|uniref:putative bifunctional diguanylate cyclase/phosphodiesterase n=1 Tax=Marinospirillum sp. TaxID=2183934 RepID=UPI002870A360|nr:EAL domain-containing protein [Marinospirillum sp.]MDR9467500.1 EAL domain-containing protein [Marinospirillum sp.]